MKTSINSVNNFIISSHNNPQYRKILRHIHESDLIRIKKGVYAPLEAVTGGMVDIESIIPGGVLCLYSAWHYYGMTTQLPDSFYVAIGRKRKVHLPDIVDITLVYQKEEFLQIGRQFVYIDGIKVEIFNRERCLCDAIKYRNKIGIDVMAEILNSYLGFPQRNLNLLSAYAKQLRVYNILSNYLNVKI